MMRNRGSIYIVTILTSGLVAVLAACALSIGRRQAQQAGLFVDTSAVNSMNESAIAAAQQWMLTDTDWRKNYPLIKPPGLNSFTGFGVALPVSRGTVQMDLSDASDSSLGAFAHDVVTMIMRTRVGQADHRAKLTLTPQTTPLPLLGYTLYGGTTMRVRDGSSILTNGLPVRVAGDLRVDGTVAGDTESATRSSSGTINGSATTGLSALSLPASTLFDTLAAYATALPSGDKKKGLLAASANTFGGTTNPYGLYVLDTGGLSVRIDHVRILGTLLVRSGAGTVTIGSAVHIRRARADLPAIIVDGNCELAAGTADLTEASVGTSLNPAGVPYGGVTDTDISDSYPSSIYGIVYVTGKLYVTASTTITGALVCGSDVDIDGNSELQINADSTFTTAPPVGFATITGYGITRGTWTRLPAP
jgi:hypothetical protein